MGEQNSSRYTYKVTGGVTNCVLKHKVPVQPPQTAQIVDFDWPYLHVVGRNAMCSPNDKRYKSQKGGGEEGQLEFDKRAPIFRHRK